MIRIHVFRLSHLLLGLSAAVLIAVLIWALAAGLKGGQSNNENTQFRQREAEAVSVSASAVFAPPDENGIEVEVIRPSRAKTVLIYHTHTHEAYQKPVDAQYVETSAWRTKDNGHNIVRVGEELSFLLEKAGFTVIHDTTDHELTDLSTAYTRSLETLLKYEGKVDYFIDLHRDAYSENGSGNPFSLKTENTDAARLMFLVGNGKGFSDKMYYRENYELATLLTGTLNEMLPGLCRPVLVKDGRYNQHLQPGAFLVEVGHNRNSIDQALSAMPYLAEAFKEVLLG